MDADNIVDSVSVLEHINKTIKIHTDATLPLHMTLTIYAIKNDANFLIDFVIGDLMVAKSRIRLLMNPDGFSYAYIESCLSMIDNMPKLFGKK